MSEGSSQETAELFQGEPNNDNLLHGSEPSNSGVVADIDESNPEKYKDITRKLKPGDIIEFKNHFTTHLEDIGKPIYQFALGVAGYDHAQVQEMIKHKKVPEELDRQIREKLASYNTQRFKYTGKYKMPKALGSTPEMQYDLDDYMRNEQVRYLLLNKSDIVSPDIETDTVYIGTGQQSKAFSGAKFGVYGSPDNKFTYFSPNPELALSHAKKDPVLLQIDLTMLAKKRHIFPDPESLHTPSEEKKTFVVMGGVPLEAVVEGSIFKKI